MDHRQTDSADCPEGQPALFMFAKDIFSGTPPFQQSRIGLQPSPDQWDYNCDGSQSIWPDYAPGLLPYAGSDTWDTRSAGFD
jgi:hypothetical protein